MRQSVRSSTERTPKGRKNDLETVQILTSSEGMLSKKTQIENHPLVTDVNDELERLEEEEKSREDKYNDLNMTKPQDGDGIIEE